MADRYRKAIAAPHEGPGPDGINLLSPFLLELTVQHKANADYVASAETCEKVPWGTFSVFSGRETLENSDRNVYIQGAI